MRRSDKGLLDRVVKGKYFYDFEETVESFEVFEMLAPQWVLGASYFELKQDLS